MADWPIAGMNNFGFPGFPHRIERIGPPTLITHYEDGREDRRQKHGTTLRRWTENWKVNRTDMASIVAFYTSKGTLTKFSKLTLDATDGGAFGTNWTWARFEKPPTYDQVGSLWYHVTLVFIEVVP